MRAKHISANPHALDGAFEKLGLAPEQRSALRWFPKGTEAAAEFAERVWETRFLRPSADLKDDKDTTVVLGKTWVEARIIAAAGAGEVEDSVKAKINNAILTAIIKYDKPTSSRRLEMANIEVRKAIGAIAYRAAAEALDEGMEPDAPLKNQAGAGMINAPQIVKMKIAFDVEEDAKTAASLVFLEAVGCRVEGFGLPWRPWVETAKGYVALGHVGGKLMLYRKDGAGQAQGLLRQEA